MHLKICSLICTWMYTARQKIIYCVYTYLQEETRLIYIYIIILYTYLYSCNYLLFKLSCHHQIRTPLGKLVLSAERHLTVGNWSHRVALLAVEDPGDVVSRIFFLVVSWMIISDHPWKSWRQKETGLVGKFFFIDFVAYFLQNKARLIAIWNNYVYRKY